MPFTWTVFFQNGHCNISSLARPSYTASLTFILPIIWWTMSPSLEPQWTFVSVLTKRIWQKWCYVCLKVIIAFVVSLSLWDADLGTQPPCYKQAPTTCGNCMEKLQLTTPAWGGGPNINGQTCARFLDESNRSCLLTATAFKTLSKKHLSEPSQPR